MENHARLSYCYDRPHVQEARCARWLGGWCAKGPRRPFIFRLLSLGVFLLISVRHINTCVRLLEKLSRNILLFPASPREPALALAPPSPPAPATAPSRRPRRSSPRSLPTHPYNLRPIPGRTRVPNSLLIQLLYVLKLQIQWMQMTDECTNLLGCL